MNSLLTGTQGATGNRSWHGENGGGGGGISVLKVSGFPTLASPDQMRPKGWHTDTCGYFVYEKRGWAQEKLIRERARASG